MSSSHTHRDGAAIPSSSGRVREPPCATPAPPTKISDRPRKKAKLVEPSAFDCKAAISGQVSNILTFFIALFKS